MKTDCKKCISFDSCKIPQKKFLVRTYECNFYCNIPKDEWTGEPLFTEVQPVQLNLFVD